MQLLFKYLVSLVRDVLQSQYFLRTVHMYNKKSLYVITD